MRLEETPPESGSSGEATFYSRVVVLGLLGLNSLLLQQILTLNREYLSSALNNQDVGLTIPGSDVPTTQFITCALAVSLPCLAILSVHYAIASLPAYLPAWIETLLWISGVTAAGVALTAAFWFINPLSAAIFVASGILFYSLYRVAVARSVRARKVRARRRADDAPNA